MGSADIELLAPAKDASAAIEAVKHGADAVYIGAPSHGARKDAANSVADISRAVDFAHRFNARVYATVNTLVYDHELRDVERLIESLYRAGIDALIIQDLGILKLDIPPIALHASTQCDIRTPATARLLQALGFSQLVLARELNLKEIAEIRKAIDVPLEAFVHGALCVSYSGCCNAGFLAMGRSGNRGECPQMCRLPYDLIDGDGRKVIAGKHLLSLKDMNRMAQLEEMADAGVSSFKIEGRLKDVAYVKNVVTAYSQALDVIVENSAGRYRRASDGFSSVSFIPDLSKSFNRGYTDYFLRQSPASHTLASIDSPKMLGTEVGVVTRADRNSVTLKLRDGVELANGDGLGYFNEQGVFEGFRLNRLENNTIYPLKPFAAPLKRGVTLYRNLDRKWERLLETDTAVRKMYIDITLRLAAGNRALVLDASDRYGHSVSVTEEIAEPAVAQKSQTDYRRALFAKLGDTDWLSGNYVDLAGDFFFPASVLTSLKNKAVKALDSCRRATRVIDYRRGFDLALLPEAIKAVGAPRNIANRKARELFVENGRSDMTEALEVSSRSLSTETPAMECRYCLRRELGACLKTPDGTKLKGPLTLDSGRGIRYRLDFDCANCRMLLHQK